MTAQCGAPATHLLISIMPEDVKTALRCMGATPAADGLSYARAMATAENL
jgi:hypothetical protein